MNRGRAAASDVAPPQQSGPAGLWRTFRGDVDLRRPVVVGILNVTPDSFSDGGRYLSPDAAISRAEEMVGEGADVLDIGGESTRPGASDVSEAEERARVLPVLEAVARRLDVPVSIDTTKAGVARAALDAGASIVNDISGLRFDPELADLAAERGAGLVLMHIRGQPRTMQENIHYDDLLGEITGELRESIEAARSRGCRPEQLVVDPGIGFGKTAEHNLILLNHLDRLSELGRPVMVGPSRKSFIGKVLGLEVEERLEGTIAACVLALARGAKVFRVHDVGQVRRALDLAFAILST